MATTRMPPPSSAGAMMSPPYGGGNVMVGGGVGGGVTGGGPPGTLAPGTQIMVGPIVVTVQKYLSQGGFAHVYLVTTDKPIPMPISATSAPGATKSTTRGETLHVLKRMAVPDKESLASVRNEVEIHKQLRNHPNIVHFIEASATGLRGGGYEIFILMEYCAGGGIIDLMNARLRTRLKENEVLKIFGDVAAGLSVMHNLNPPLMHRDLKVENILLSPPPKSNPGIGPTYKLCDFGSSKPLISRKPAQTLDEVKLVEADLNKCTTLQYRAPEMVDVYQRRVIDEKADIWAMGVLLYKLCYYTTPFEENGGGPLAILNARYRFPAMPVYSQRLKDLIASMLQEQSSARPSIDEVLLRVHRMMGTQPPASVLNKISAAMKNDNKQQTQRPSSMSKNDDLIEVGQTEADRKRADEEALRKTSEAITPMRRGRPTKSSVGNTAMAAAKFEQASASPMAKSSSASIGINRLNSINATSPPNAAFSPDRATPPLGFSDSFAPSSLKSGMNKDLTGDPSRPGSALEHSPSLPGFDASSHVNSARVSPLPPPVASGSSAQLIPEKDDDTSTRFPSVEELDRRYPTENVKQSSMPSPSSQNRSIRSPPIISPSSSSRSPQSIHSSIPGLSNRAPVSAMADKFGAMAASKRSSVPVQQSKPLPPVGSKPSGLSSIGNRWPHQNSQEITSPSSLSSSSDRFAPSLPSRKHDWLQRNGTGEVEQKKDPSLPLRKHDWLEGNGTGEIEQKNDPKVPIEKTKTKEIENQNDSDDSSVEDDLPPEDLDAPTGKVPSSFAQAKERTLARQKEASTYKPSNQSISAPGKVKTPDWIKNQRSNDIISSKSGEPLPTQVNAQSTPSSSLQESQFDDMLNNQKAKPPAWDEDDEEMHFLPQPSIHSTPSGRPLSQFVQPNEEVKNTGRLIDFDDAPQEPAVQSVVAAPKKQSVDVATSPRQGSPTEEEVVTAANVPPHKSVSIGNMASRFENIQIAGSEENTFKKPILPVKPGNIQLRNQESMNGMMTGTSQENEEKDQISRMPPTIANKPSRLSTSSSTFNNVPKKSASMPPTSVGQAPPLTNRMSKPTTFSQSQTIALPTTTNLKPWEKEAMEKERVEKFGSLRSRSPVKQYVEEIQQQQGDEWNVENKKSIGKGEAQDRFQGVSSLISQWQANASKGAPGWGTVGKDSIGVEVERDESRGNRFEKKRLNSKDEDEIYRTTRSDRSNSIKGRLPSREV